MIFTPLAIAGAYRVDLATHGDDRGFFARIWCEDEARAHGCTPHMVQANASYTAAAGTVRGLHYQRAPHAEAKLVRCTAGALYDVIVDVRPESPTYLQHLGLELTAANRTMLYLPEGCAHGYQTLAPDTEAFYFVSAPYAPAAEAGLRYDDPALAIDWPHAVTNVSAKDRAWPLLHDATPSAP
ncbi:dTDP-4-dehydrorhamnose 3,5-epimerase family protein [Salisaeta longa]|uniref:dTDP-4-dehydrorhamnose 3,5-epimerase family protein n=1 Tax=Salisaeta longa TaxID=503170 RepID=UPI0003B75959|nr:dTDP-4-dehydrorhamnose 3,5-epimerase family protein [Salisaeta longa]